MDKIQNFNLFNDFIKKPENRKKTKNIKNLKLSGKKKIPDFEEELNLQEIEFETQVYKEKEKKLEDLLKDIGKQGEILKKTKQLAELDLYKKKIKEFLEIFLSIAEKLEKKFSWDKEKKEKIAKIHLHIINNELMELTRIFFQEQQNTLAIAAKIDKIEGMLIDMIS